MRDRDLDIVERIKRILASKGLTLYQVSEKSRALYGRSSPHFLPHNLYYALSSGNFSPSLQQLFTLSKISNYLFHDWLRVFDFRIEEIPRLQFLLHSKRTVILDSAVEDLEGWIAGFSDKSNHALPTSITSIGALLTPSHPVRIKSRLPAGPSDFLFAKIGQQDASAFPSLLPGSIIRVRCIASRSSCREISPDRQPLFFIQLQNGYRCCRLKTAGTNRVVLLASELEDFSKEMRVGRDIQIVGKADLEIRSLLNQEQAVTPSQTVPWHLSDPRKAPRSLGRLLQQRRRQSGLSLREASAASRRVASELQDEQYFAAIGSLSDYEAINSPPRHVHKIITLCILYGICFEEFLNNAPLNVGEGGRDRIPDILVPRKRLNPSDFEISAKKAKSETRESHSLLSTTSVTALPVWNSWPGFESSNGHSQEIDKPKLKKLLSQNLSPRTNAINGISPHGTIAA